jgi:urease gamma subunit
MPPDYYQLKHTQIMHLTPKEQDKLTLLTLGMIAERRLKNGIKLVQPSATAGKP